MGMSETEIPDIREGDIRDDPYCRTQWHMQQVVDGLKAEVERLMEHTVDAGMESAKRLIRALAAESQRDRLLEYVVHDIQCPATLNDGPCKCGLADIEKEISGE